MFVATGVSGHHVGQVWSNWATPNASGDRLVRARFVADAMNYCPVGGSIECTNTGTCAPYYANQCTPGWPYSGVVVDSCEYQRFQSGVADPTSARRESGSLGPRVTPGGVTRGHKRPRETGESGTAGWEPAGTAPSPRTWPEKTKPPTREDRGLPFTSWPTLSRLRLLSSPLPPQYEPEPALPR